MTTNTQNNTGAPQRTPAEYRAWVACTRTIASVLFRSRRATATASAERPSIPPTRVSNCHGRGQESDRGVVAFLGPGAHRVAG